MIVVFGSLNMDIVVRVEKLPAPGETILAPTYDLFPGGKGANQAIAAAKAGADVHFFGVVGRDDYGAKLIENLKKNNVATEGILVTSDMPTGCAYISVDNEAENQIVVASGANSLAREDLIPDAFLTPETFVLLQMEVPAEENWKLARRARARGAKVCLNLAPFAPVPAEVLTNIDFFIANRLEAADLSKDFGMSSSDHKELAKFFSDSFDLGILITLGSDGVFARCGSDEYYTPAHKVNPVDTTGAGDSFVGAFASYIYGKRDFSTALRAGTIAGALATLSMGVNPPSHIEIDRILS